MVGDAANVEKIRYARLNQVFNRALKQSLTKFQDWDKFSSCFPQYSQTKDGVTHLVNCQKQITEFWTELCHREFEEILKERDVHEKLDELDVLIAEARNRLEDKAMSGQNSDKIDDRTLDMPISELTTSELLGCSLYSERKKAAKDLDQRLQTIRNFNDQLENDISNLESDITQEYNEISKTYSHFMGNSLIKNPDRELQQGLEDMISEQNEYFNI